MMRYSVAVNSRPSIFACRPVPPKNWSTMAKTSLGSSTMNPIPRQGWIFTMFRLVGRCREYMYSLNFLILIGLTATSGERLNRL